MNYRGPGFLCFYDLAPSPSTTPALSISSSSDTGRLRKRDNLLYGIAKSYDGENVWSSIYSLILFGFMLCAPGFPMDFCYAVALMTTFFVQCSVLGSREVLMNSWFDFDDKALPILSRFSSRLTLKIRPLKPTVPSSTYSLMRHNYSVQIPYRGVERKYKK